MVNNFTNINKTYNYLSPQSIEHKKYQHNGFLGSGLRQAQNCGSVKWISTGPTIEQSSSFNSL